MKKKNLHVVLLIGVGLIMASCTEDIVMDLPAGRKIPVVEGSISNEFKRHEIILSYSSELYSTDDTEMISGAEVFVTSGDDTIWYNEQEDKPGHYLTDSVAGRKNRRYHLKVEMGGNNPSSSYHINGESKMANNANGIDSLGLLPLRNKQGIPFVNDSAAVCICPYFQTLSDPDIIYNVELYLNDKLFKNRPSKLMNLFSMKGYAGYYFNGPEMLEDNIEIPVGVMNKVYLHDGDVIKVKLYSISQDYMYFLLEQKLAVGVNPIMGAFPAMFSNLLSDCNAIGWFNAISVIEAENVYHESMFQQ
jgi:hypothetical protein